MAVVYLANAFSLQMLDLSQAVDVHIEPISSSEVSDLVHSQSVVSAIGHADTAAVVSDIIGYPISASRIGIHMSSDDVLIVAQLVGGRLPEGSTTLPPGFEIRFFRVQI